MKNTYCSLFFIEVNRGYNKFYLFIDNPKDTQIIFKTLKATPRGCYLIILNNC